MEKKKHECRRIKESNIKLEYDDYWHSDWCLHYGDYTWEYIDGINYCPFCGVKL
jgi:hypothetical protein